MNIQLFEIPYDSGHRSARAGRGPGRFLDRGVVRMLADCGHQVSVSRIESQAPLTTEVGTSFELNRLLAEQVRAAINEHKFPLVLAGNCNTSVGAVSGLDKRGLGIVWFDAHGDFNTPETTLSGFLDGMGLAMATGRGWQAILHAIPGYAPIPASNVIHIGGRALDEEEGRLMRESGMAIVPPGGSENGVRAALDAALARMQERVSRFHIHVDMDVLDTGDIPPNQLAVPGGLAVGFVEEIIARIKEKIAISAAALTSYEPDFDQGDRVLDAGMRLIKVFVA